MAGFGQAQNQPFRITVRADLVQVPVVVTDRQGKLITHLKQEDFEILENGRSQSISLFRPPSLETRGHTPDSPGDIGAGAAHFPNATADGNYFILLFDNLHLSPSGLEYARRAAFQFLREFKNPADYVTLAVTGSGSSSQGFTQDGEALSKLVAQIQSAATATLPVYVQGLPISDEDLYNVYQNDIDTIESLATAILLAKDPLRRKNVQKERELIIRDLQSAADRSIREHLQYSERTIHKLVDLIQSAAEIPASKTLILLSEGFRILEEGSPLGDASFARVLAHVATRTNTTVYTINMRGLEVGLGFEAERINTMMASPSAHYRSLSRARGGREEVLTAVAHACGGESFQNSNDYSLGFRRVRDLRAGSYWLGYSPHNQEMKGEFRKIEVRLRNDLPGARIVARKGYLAVAATPQFTLSPAAQAKHQIDHKKLKQIQRELAKGGEAFQKGELEKAARIYTKLAKTYPSLAEPHLQLGLIWHKMGDRSQAREAWKSGISADPRDITCYLLLGASLLETREYEPGRRYLEQARELKPDDPEVIRGLRFIQAKTQPAPASPPAVGREAQAERRVAAPAGGQEPPARPYHEPAPQAEVQAEPTVELGAPRVGLDSAKLKEVCFHLYRDELTQEVFVKTILDIFSLVEWPAGVPLIAAALEHGHPLIQMKVIEMLSESRQPEAAALLRQASRSPFLPIRIRAVRALIQTETEVAVLRRLLADSSLEVQGLAARALADRQDRESIPALEERLDKATSPVLRIALAGALDRLGSPTGRPILDEMVKSPYRHLQMRVREEQLRAFGGPPEPALELSPAHWARQSAVLREAPSKVRNTTQQKLRDIIARIPQVTQADRDFVTGTLLQRSSGSATVQRSLWLTAAITYLLISH